MICQDEDVNDLGDCKNGIETLIEYSKLFNLNHLSSQEATVKVCKKCQKNVGNLIRKRKADPTFNIDCASKVAKVTTRGSVDGFKWKIQCLICGKPCAVDHKHSDRRKIWSATFLHYKNTILEFCDTRQNDEWGEQVRSRVINCCDLVQVEARHQEDCRTKFTRRKGKLLGRPARHPTNETQKDNFEKLCDCPKCESEIYSFEELHIQND